MNSYNSYQITFSSIFIFALKTYNSGIYDVQYGTNPWNTLFFEENQSLNMKYFQSAVK